MRELMMGGPDDPRGTPVPARELSFEATIDSTMVFPCPHCNSEIVLSVINIRNNVRAATTLPAVMCPCGAECFVKELDVELMSSERRDLLKGRLIFTQGSGDYPLTGFPKEEIPIIDVSESLKRNGAAFQPSPEEAPPDSFDTSDDLFQSIFKKK
jgi:hypothetical protein